MSDFSAMFFRNEGFLGWILLMISQNSYAYSQKIWMRKPKLNTKFAISENFEWSLTLYGRALQRTNKHLQDLPTVLNGLNIQSFVNYLLSLKICADITDYADVLLHRLEIKQPFTNDSKEIVAFVENSNRTVLRKEEFNRIRHRNCLQRDSNPQPLSS